MPMLLKDKILIVLNGGGPRTIGEIADILGTKRTSTSSANTLNVQTGLVDYIRAKKGEAKMQITPTGITHVQTRLASTYTVASVVKPSPVRDNLIAQLKKGLWSKDWPKVCKSRSTLYKWIVELKNEGYSIVKKKHGVEVRYKIVAEPIKVPVE